MGTWPRVDHSWPTPERWEDGLSRPFPPKKGREPLHSQKGNLANIYPI